MGRTSCCVFLAVLGLAGFGQTAHGQWVQGADLSLLQHLEDHGVVYKEVGKARDPLAIFKEHGCTHIRLRLFLAPNGEAGQVNTLSYTLALARRAQQAGLKLLLNLHYSDGWADPGHQVIPREWRDLPHEELVDRVLAYTRETVCAFLREGVTPDMVAVGNEITNGMMWPAGGPLSESKWDAFADLLKAGILGVREADAEGSIRVMVQIDKGGNREVSRWFFDNLERRGVAFDVIGLSYYPFWHGTFSNLEENLAFLATTYKRDIMVVETCYDTWGGPQGDQPFPLTEAGQKAFLEALNGLVAATPEGRGKGVFYWAPEWIQGENRSGGAPAGPWGSRALFDRKGNMRPAMEAFAGPVTGDSQ